MIILPVVIRILCDFPIQLIVAANMFAWAFPKRSHFWLREVLIFTPMLVVYDICWQTFGQNVLENAVLDKSLMLIPVTYICAGIFFCYRCSVTDAIFCSASAHPAQNMVYSLFHIVELQWGISKQSPLALLVSLTIMVLIYGAVYHWFARRLRDVEEYQFMRKRLLINSTIVMLFVVFLYAMVVDDTPAILITFVIGDILALIMQFGLFSESALEQRYAIVEQLLYTEQKRQRQISETTEIIDRKCHDLKHQIAQLKRMEDGPERNRYFREVEDAIMIYESAVKSGNETLDLLLMDKLLYCEKHQIKLTCVADGKLIEWMDTMDICSLFGNALDNAIESVSQEPEENNRIISFRISRSGQMVSMHFENYVGHEIKLRNGLPVTSKQDKQYHGFGVLSIQRIVEKYGGTMSIRVEDHLFRLNILIPIPSTRDSL